MPEPKAYKLCRQCRREYQPWSLQSSLNRWCSPECAALWAQHKRERERLRVQRKATMAQREALKTLSDWTKEAQVEFNAFVRERDRDCPCMACGTTNQSTGITGSSWDAGHYRSRGSAPHLRFHLLNTWKVCTRCNRQLSGNVVDMRKGMVARLGEARVAQLEHDDAPKQYRLEDMRRIKSIFRRRTRLYRRLRDAR